VRWSKPKDRPRHRNERPNFFRRLFLERRRSNRINRYAFKSGFPDEKTKVVTTPQPGAITEAAGGKS